MIQENIVVSSFYHLLLEQLSEDKHTVRISCTLFHICFVINVRVSLGCNMEVKAYKCWCFSFDVFDTCIHGRFTGFPIGSNGLDACLQVYIGRDETLQVILGFMSILVTYGSRSIFIVYRFSIVPSTTEPIVPSINMVELCMTYQHHPLPSFLIG